MKKLSHIAAAVSLGLACAMPAMAQDSGSASSTTTPSTTVQSTPDTQSMGAGPDDMDTTARTDGDRDLGWIGLLGLAGLLGLRRRHDRHDHDGHVHRTGPVR
jgi:MYXO-CTERM domain-containing protein